MYKVVCSFNLKRVCKNFNEHLKEGDGAIFLPA